MELVEMVYHNTAEFPVNEQFGLINQIRRCAVSIPSNIAEGAGRNSNRDFKRFLGIASGSCNELETQILISIKLGYVEKSNYTAIASKIVSIQNMLYKLQKSLK